MSPKEYFANGTKTNKAISEETGLAIATVRSARSNLKKAGELEVTDSQAAARSWLSDHNLDAQTHQIEFSQKISKALLDEADLHMLNMSLNGMPYQDIADHFGVNMTLVRTRMGRVYKELNVKRTEAVEMLSIRGEIKAQKKPSPEN